MSLCMEEVKLINILAKRVSEMSITEKDNLHSNFRDEYDKELPYHRNGASPEMIATAIYYLCELWDFKSFGEKDFIHLLEEFINEELRDDGIEESKEP